MNNRARVMAALPRLPAPERSRTLPGEKNEVRIDRPQIDEART